MTTRELRSEVSAFCYTDIGEKDARFIAYANLALRTLYSELCIVGEHRIKLGQKPIYHNEKILHKGGEIFSLPLVGNSYSMIVSGTGTVTVSDSDGERSKSFDTEETAICGFLSGAARLTLIGDEDFYVFSLSCFTDRFGGNISAIRIMKPKSCYSMRELVTDFGSFVTYPTDGLGNPVTDVELFDDKIIVSAKRYGEINVIYKRLPKRILIDFPEEEIDIPSSYSVLLGILCSYFILLEDDKERASYFKALYNEGIKSVKNNRLERIDGGYTNINGWA